MLYRLAEGALKSPARMRPARFFAARNQGKLRAPKFVNLAERQDSRNSPAK
jgi:hypothetical protein